ncbi:MAG: FKBP-type peptidyl-prolyl cis-trans isomerase [Bacteroidetes bacterium]|nr:FKBP-type peptidyl-prolyl cis-trans isomerase [Bacteroidota bacterium]
MKRFIRLALPLFVSILLLAGCDSDSTESGELIITDLVSGTGQLVAPGHTLITSYVGRFTDGTQFDASSESGTDWVFTLGVGQVIKGWDQGLGGMKVGGTRKLEIPSHLAFGKSGQCFSDDTCAVPPNTDVVYEITVLDIFDEVQIEDVIEGDGAIAETGDVVFVEYIGTLRNGDVFDSTSLAGTEFFFTLGTGSVIPGWDQGLPGMKVGGTRRLTIPPILAYGQRQISGPLRTVPPFSVLIFDIELKSIIKSSS